MAIFPDLITDLLKDGYKVSFTAPGHSMFHTIMANETVVVEPITPSDVHKGDIVLYRSNGDLIAHRVMGVITEAKANEYKTLFKAFNPAQTSTASQDSAKKAYQPSALNPNHFFILRGDAALNFDEPILSAQVLGKVISIERNGSGINPYSLRHKLACWFYKWTSRIKKLF